MELATSGLITKPLYLSPSSTLPRAVQESDGCGVLLASPTLPHFHTRSPSILTQPSPCRFFHSLSPSSSTSLTHFLSTSFTHFFLLLPHPVPPPTSLTFSTSLTHVLHYTQCFLLSLISHLPFTSVLYIRFIIIFSISIIVHVSRSSQQSF